MVPPWAARMRVVVFIVRSGRQPLGSIIPPWAARMWVVVLIVGSRQPLGSMPQPLPAGSCVVVFIALSSASRWALMPAALAGVDACARASVSRWG